jgi:protein-tyrosine-phosphatase
MCTVHIDRHRFLEEAVPLQLEPRTRERLTAEVKQLSSRFRGVFSQETIERFVDESLERFSEARIHQYLPVLVHRFASERLTALGQAEGKIAKAVPEVLFVCVENAGRSQMAAALLGLAAGEEVHIRSAGSDPAEGVNPAVIEAMAEVGADLADAFPKPLTDEVVRAADVVITMGCGDACALYPGKRYENWEVEDPAGKDIDAVRTIRVDIARRVDALLTSIEQRSHGHP